MIETRVNCDCGCGAVGDQHSLDAWFRLEQVMKPPGNEPKIDRELQFQSLECLGRWIKRALKVLPSLQKSAKYFGHSRGDIVDRDVAGLFV
jgi:hypothetical protein